MVSLTNQLKCCGSLYSAITCAIVSLGVGYACLVVIYSFTRQVSIGQDAHIFILFHDN